MHKKKTKIIIGILIFLLIIYVVICWFLVDAALVPSFMEKQDAFEELTEKGEEEQVHTEDIEENRETSLSETQIWYQNAEKEDVSITTEDGYTLNGKLFPREKGNHNWVMLLHGYTG